MSKVAQLESKLNEAVENFSTSREAAMDDSGLADVVEQLKTEMKSHEETLRELQTGMATFKIREVLVYFIYIVDTRLELTLFYSSSRSRQDHQLC